MSTKKKRVYRDSKGRFAKRPRFAESTLRKYRREIDFIDHQVIELQKLQHRYEREYSKVQREHSLQLKRYDAAKRAVDTREQRRIDKIEHEIEQEIEEREHRREQKKSDLLREFRYSVKHFKGSVRGVPNNLVSVPIDDYTYDEIIDLVQQLLEEGLYKYYFILEAPKPKDVVINPYKSKERTVSVMFSENTDDEQIRRFLRISKDNYRGSFITMNFWQNDMPETSDLFGVFDTDIEADTSGISAAKKRYKILREQRQKRAQLRDDLLFSMEKKETQLLQRIERIEMQVDRLAQRSAMLWEKLQ